MNDNATGAGDAKEPHKSTRHSLYEDALAYLLGGALCAFGVQILQEIGLVTGQTAGAAVLIAYLTDWSFGAVFFVLNAPFYLLAWFRMGARFTIKTAIAVAIVSVMAEFMPNLVQFDFVEPAFGALLSGALIGMGLIAIFRHGASLGGVGVVALLLQEKAGIQAGWVQLGFDAVLFAIAFLVLDPWLTALSLVGAAVVNVIVAVNHRHDRYVGR
ncbi:MAG: YitT family protein [Pseudomonadota bacterium]